MAQAHPVSTPYWQHTATPENVKNLLNGRLNRLRLHSIDVHDFKELLDIRSLRFAERLFSLIDVHCSGFIGIEELTDFVYSFETSHLQFRLNVVFHCYDTLSRGYLSIADIKMMFMENLIEGECSMNHQMVECLTDAALSQIQATGSFVSYPQMMDVMTYQPQLLCHLVKSKIPIAVEDLSLKWQNLKDSAMDHSGKLIFLMVFLLICSTSLAVGLSRYRDDDLAEIVGWTHAVGRSTSDLFKGLIGIFVLLQCKSTPFLYRKLPKPFYLRFPDFRFFRKVVLVVGLLVSLVHSFCQIINVWRLSQNGIRGWTSIFGYDTAQPTFQSLLGSNVFITGTIMLVLITFSVFVSISDSWTSPTSYTVQSCRLMLFHTLKARIVAAISFTILIAAHSSSTFLRSCLRLPCLFWLWFGFPFLALILDHFIGKLLDPPSKTEIIEFRVLPDKGVLLNLTKPIDCRLGALSFVLLRFPGSYMNETRSFPVLSHPSEDHLTVLVEAKDSWSIALLQHLQYLNPKTRPNSGQSAEGDTGVGRNSFRVRSSHIATRRSHRPERLTRLNTRLVYLTSSQRVDGVIGDDPQAVAAQRPQSEITPAPEPRRGNGNFNVIFEITPASLSTTEESIRREEQNRPNSRQVTDESLLLPISSASPSKRSEVYVGLDARLRGPYKLNNSLQEEKLMKTLSCPVIFVASHGLDSLPVVPLCSYLLRRRLVGSRQNNQKQQLEKIIVSWQLMNFEDVAWLLEVAEPLFEIQSLIQLEMKIYVDPVSGDRSQLNVFFNYMERLIDTSPPPQVPLESKMAVSFGKIDWEYQMEDIKSKVEQNRVGLMVDVPYGAKRRISEWVSCQEDTQFDFLSIENLLV